MIHTCSLCGQPIFGGHWGLCLNHFKEWTVTGTFPVPVWLKIFSLEHHRDEMRRYHTELNFSDLQDEQEDLPTT